MRRCRCLCAGPTIYSWDRPDLNCLWNSGVRFLCRYGSGDPSKDLSASELDKILARGMSVCVVHQYSKTQTAGGYSAGQADGRKADSFVAGLGMAGLPVYFPCDQDYEAMSSAAKSSADAYFDGVKSVLGLARTGGYGDDTFCKRMFDTGRVTYGWNTYAWSEGGWETRAQLRQVKNDVTVCGGKIDWDEAWAPDHGQWPRPATAQPQPPAQQEEETGMFAVVIPPGTGVDTEDPSNDIGVSLDKTSYTAVGFCCDPGRLGGGTVSVRVAWHRMDGFWGVGTAEMTPERPKAVLSFSGGKVDGVSFRRQDAIPISLYPNFA